MTPELKKKLLRNQVNLNFMIMDLTEDELLVLIKEEQQNKKRLPYVIRCYRRLSILRKRREKGLVLAGVFKANSALNAGASSTEIKAFKALKEEQKGKKRIGVLNSLYMAYYESRREREEAQLKEFRFGT